MASTSKAIMTPTFRVSFPEVWEKKSMGEGQPGRYSLTALFCPAEFTDNDKAKWKELLAACDRVAREKWKKSFQEAKQQGGYKLPFHKGEEKSYAGYGPGIIFCSFACSVRAPGIIDRNGERITRDGPEEFYAGCYARATINPYVPARYQKTMALGLNNIQKLRDGERLDAFTSAEDDFGSDPVEYDDEAGAAEQEFDPAA